MESLNSGVDDIISGLNPYNNEKPRGTSMQYNINGLGDLLEQLQVNFPNRLPVKEVSAHDLGVLVGQQQVVEFILGLIKGAENG